MRGVELLAEGLEVEDESEDEGEEEDWDIISRKCALIVIFRSLRGCLA